MSVEPVETGGEEGSEEGASQPSGKRQRFRLDRDTEVEVTSSVEEGRERRAQKEQRAEEVEKDARRPRRSGRGAEGPGREQNRITIYPH